MKPVNMNDGGRNISIGGSAGASLGGVVTAPHYSEEIAKAATEWGIKYRYAYAIVSAKNLSDEEKVELIKQYKKLG